MVLVTAFEPFGGAAVNASLEAARLWAERDPKITVVELPVVHGLAEEQALAAVEAVRPTLYLALGEAGPTPEVRLERTAFNIDDYRIPDNAGNTIVERPIKPSGAPQLLATVDTVAVAAALLGKTPLPVRLSDDAGRFLCNHLSYQMLDANLPCPFLFIHLPSWRPEDGSVALDTIVTTLQAILEQLA